MLIKPTVGRVVWYYPHGKTQIDAGEQPYAALVAYVHSDRCVNLAYFNNNGVSYSATSVQLVQEEDEIPQYACCMWIPYQLGQAKKNTE